MNMLALLGWNPGTEQEIFSLEELTRLFTLERVGKSGSRFDPNKARWFNHHYLVTRDDATLAQEFGKVLQEKGIAAETSLVVKIIGMVKDRVDFVKDIWAQSSFFFIRPESFDTDTIRKKWKPETAGLLNGLIVVFNDLAEFKAETIKAAAEAYAAEHSAGMGQIILPTRICLVGGTFGPDVFTICELLGREEVIARMQAALVEISRMNLI